MSKVTHVKGCVSLLALIAFILSSLAVAARGSSPGSAALWMKVESLEDELGNKNLDELWKKVKEAQELGEKAEKLAPEDDQYEPEYDPAGMPEIPASCKDNSQCEECFTKPYTDLNNLRFRFEKLRKINRSTKNMLRDYIAFGDGAANLAGGVVPLAWAQEKEKIRQSEKNFNASYDAKYAELLGTLKANLQAIAACEEKVFGEQGWYERYGFMYYQFMAATYRRPD